MLQEDIFNLKIGEIWAAYSSQGAQNGVLMGCQYGQNGQKLMKSPATMSKNVKVVKIVIFFILTLLEHFLHLEIRTIWATYPSQGAQNCHVVRYSQAYAHSASTAY